MRRTAVINVVGLTARALGPHTPRLAALAARGSCRRVAPVLPAVTCTAQATYLTGLAPRGHGIVGNGWFHRDLAEVHFWKQSNRLVQGRKLWEELRATVPGFTCANLFWWFNMYSTVDYAVTPRPLYPADGRKVFDIYAWPYALRHELKLELGEFPFPTFWGPAAGVPTSQGAPDAASRWIAAAAREVERRHRPTLSLIYLPHLDYNFQRFGPDHAGSGADLGRIDAIVGELMDFFAAREVQVVGLSEYGLAPVDTPVHVNRCLRERGWLTVKEELGRELLDAGASRAFAVADHQVAHVYVQDPTLLGAVRSALEALPGIEAVWGPEEQARWGLDHPRAGELIAVAAERAWFTYYHWLDDRRAPDFARTVDIHRKPGYDPAELFLDPRRRAVKWRVAGRLLQKRLGFRMLMDVIPLDATLVRGSHGRRPADPLDWPVLLTERREPEGAGPLEATAVYDVLKRAVLE